MCKQPLRKGSTTHPEIVTTFQTGHKQQGGLVQYAMTRAKVQEGDAAAVWASPSCKEETKVLRLSQGSAHPAGVQGGQVRSQFAASSAEAIIAGLLQWQKQRQGRQYTVEQPGESALGPMLTARLGTPVQVTGCRYGRLSKKPYDLWMSEPAKTYLAESYAETPLCKHCTNKTRHDQGQTPARGSKQSRVKEDGVCNEAARNRVPPRLAQAAGAAMKRAWLERCGPAE